jgi:transcriptional regulator with XRE-family HTH domain
MSMQQLADRTQELGMPIPQSVLANLESGRRDTVSVAEVLVLAAALDVAPIELICPVGFDEHVEMLPGIPVDPLAAMRWFTGERKLQVVDDGAILSQPGAIADRSNAYLVKQHDELINVLREQEAEAAKAIADAAAEGADDRARDLAGYRMSSVADLRKFIGETLRLLRAEMRNRGMLLPDLPPDVDLSEADV